jgi:lipopolysaccharide biosynthesis glycosyltransferase
MISLKISLTISLLIIDLIVNKLETYNITLNKNKKGEDKINNITDNTDNTFKDMLTLMYNPDTYPINPSESYNISNNYTIYNSKNVVDDFNKYIKDDQRLYNIYKKRNSSNANNKMQKKIPIAFSVDDNYIYPLIVLLTSIIYNSSPKTFYSFHLLVPSNFTDESKNKLFGLSKKYPNKCEYIFHDMKDKYIGWPVYGNYTETVYYRLALSDIVKDLNKIIYLDCDTMVHKDLTEFYNLDIGDYRYMGFPGHELGYIEINGTRNFINSGVMLINLKRLREDNAPKLFEDYYYLHGTQKVDEYLINVIFYEKIKFLPFIYGIPDFEPHHIIGSPTIFWNSLNGFCNGTEEEMKWGDNNRCITHGAYKDVKWWSRDYYNLSYIGRKWLYYGYRSNVFDGICEKYAQFQKICKQIKNFMKKMK